MNSNKNKNCSMFLMLAIILVVGTTTTISITIKPTYAQATIDQSQSQGFFALNCNNINTITNVIVEDTASQSTTDIPLLEALPGTAGTQNDQELAQENQNIKKVKPHVTDPYQSFQDKSFVNICQNIPLNANAPDFTATVDQSLSQSASN